MDRIVITTDNDMANTMNNYFSTVKMYLTEEVKSILRSAEEKELV